MESAARFQRVPELLSGVERFIPEHKPALEQIVVDDEGRVWAGRTVPAGEAPILDGFTADSNYVGSIRLFPGTSREVPPVIREGRVYAITEGEFDEQYVVAGPLPLFDSVHDPSAQAPH